MSEAEANVLLACFGFDAEAEFVPDLGRLNIHPSPRLTCDQLKTIGREMSGIWAVIEVGSPLY